MYISHEQLKSGDFNIVEWYMECLEGPDRIELGYIELPQGKETHLNIKCSKTTQSGSSYSALECNAVITKDITRTIPKPVVVVVHINEQPAHALVDMGSLIWLEKPLPIQLAMQGS